MWGSVSPLWRDIRNPLPLLTWRVIWNPCRYPTNNWGGLQPPATNFGVWPPLVLTAQTWRGDTAPCHTNPNTGVMLGKNPQIPPNNITKVINVPHITPTIRPVLTSPLKLLFLSNIHLIVDTELSFQSRDILCIICMYNHVMELW